MIAKFKSFNKLLEKVNEGIRDKTDDVEWFKFKVEQIANRIAASHLN